MFAIFIANFPCILTRYSRVVTGCCQDYCLKRKALYSNRDRLSSAYKWISKWNIATICMNHFLRIQGFSQDFQFVFEDQGPMAHSHAPEEGKKGITFDTFVRRDLDSL